MSSDEPFYDITEGDWRVVAVPHGEQQARIEFTYRGEPFKAVNGYPAYKVWNIPAHLHDIIEGFESHLAPVVPTPSTEEPKP